MASIQQITASLYQISLGVVNVFVIKDNGLTLIDTGYQGSMEAIFSALRKGGENPAAIKQIILTHAHPDHAGSAAAIKKGLGIPLLAHQSEAPVLEKGTGEGAPIHVSPGVVNWLIYQLFIKRGGSAIDPVGVDRYVSDGDMIPVAGGLQVIHTPGHSSGHIALWLKQEGVLIAGDLCANVAGLDLSTVYEDRALGIQSIVKIAGLNFDKAVFGHGRLLEPKANQKLDARFGAVRSKQHAG
jgi:glyoxylase-like metal-dependent hydrolase (beta-lactamase superfamily II)